MIIRSYLKNKLNNLVVYCVENKRLARVEIDKFLRSENFDSKVRKSALHYFYSALRFYGIFQKSPELFDPEMAYEKLDNIKEITPDIINEYMGTDSDISKMISENITAEQFIRFLYRAPLTIRSNALKITKDRLFDILSRHYSVTQTDVSPFGIIFDKHINARQIPEFKKGFFEIQDEASQIIPFCLDVKPGDNVLDYCAGSGGKSLAVSSILMGSTNIYINDADEMRLNNALKRSKITGSGLKTFKNKSMQFDKVLVDVPCSGLGAMRRDADLHLRLDRNLIRRLVLKQREIFEESVSFVKKGGVIVYATCSFLKDENEKQVEYFLEEFDNLQLLNAADIIDKTFAEKIETDPFFRSMPDRYNMDGFFAAIFRVL